MNAKKEIKSICVFCASSVSTDDSINQTAIGLGQEMLNRSISLVYGGGTRGLMGKIATTIHGII